MAVAGPERARQVFEDYADLAAVGTVADVMPMTGRTVPLFRPDWPLWPTPSGWAWPSSSRRRDWGIGPLTSVSIGYTLAPASTPPDAWARRLWPGNWLLTHSPQRAQELAQELCQLNRERQNIEGEIFQECIQRLDHQPQQGAIVLADRSGTRGWWASWPPPEREVYLPNLHDLSGPGSGQGLLPLLGRDQPI